MRATASTAPPATTGTTTRADRRRRGCAPRRLCATAVPASRAWARSSARCTATAPSEPPPATPSRRSATGPTATAAPRSPSAGRARRAGLALEPAPEAGALPRDDAAGARRPSCRRGRRRHRLRHRAGGRGEPQLLRGALPLAGADHGGQRRAADELRARVPASALRDGERYRAAIRERRVRHRLLERRHRARRQPRGAATLSRRALQGRTTGVRLDSEPLVPGRDAHAGAGRALAAARARRPRLRRPGSGALAGARAPVEAGVSRALPDRRRSARRRVAHHHRRRGGAPLAAVDALLGLLPAALAKTSSQVHIRLLSRELPLGA